VNLFKPALANCKGMGDDLQKIETWAQIFEQPKALITEASKHYLLHKKKVKADIAQEESDWAAKKYFDAGKDTANTVDILVPFPKSGLTYDLDIKAGVEFLGGFLQGFVGDNHMADIQACETDALKEEKAIRKALADLKAGHKVKAIMELKKLVSKW